MLGSLRPTWLALTAASALASCGGDPAVSTKSDFVFEATIDPSPPIVGQNTMTFALKDLAGNPVVGAALSVDPEMPQHGHGSPEVPVVQDLGGGQYKASPVSLIMVGRWEVTVTASQGALRGKKMFPIDVP